VTKNISKEEGKGKMDTLGTLKMEAAVYFEMLMLSTRLHGVTYQKTIIYIFAV
jgi:hypothetical protein